MSIVIALTAAPGALAATSQSSNWAGYAIHRTGVSFKRVSARWKQPRATCAAGFPTYSSVWVGLGGFTETSGALEQIGTELDCSASGRDVSSVWYELVPAPSRAIKMSVAPGDELSASVSVTGQEVSLSLRDLTRHHSFTKRLRASVLDVSSAEWITEAPSECSQSFACQTLPLADFGQATFSQASAATTSGHAGSISDRNWGLTRITLAPTGHEFIGNDAAGEAASASPSALSSRGSAFTVTYHADSAVASPALARDRVVADGSLVRPGFAPGG